MTEDAVKYIEKSFLAPLIGNDMVTDISYNGESLYYVDNRYGRRKSDISVSGEDAMSFLRQIANLTEKSINTSNPILDVSFGRYRLNGINLSIGRHKTKKAPSFSLRIASISCKIEKDPQFMDEMAKKVLVDILDKRRSIVIGGQTGTGKTELQKWCLLNLPENSRVVVLDNVEELDLLAIDSIDMTTWMAGENGTKNSLNVLIKNALRHNPDYLIVAEARGEEMLEALASSGSGHPLITTIHAENLSSMPHRLARMALMANANITMSELMEEVEATIPYYVYLRREMSEDGSIKRYLQSIGHYHNKEMEILYERGKR